MLQYLYSCVCSLWQVFADAARNDIEAEAAMYQAISELPPPNRDTLSYIMLHFQKVIDNQDKNKMDKNNLAIVFGPTIVGYSSPTIEPLVMELETTTQKKVLIGLLNISEDYWKTLLEPKGDNNHIFGYLKASTPEAMFGPISNYHSPKTGGPAKRTRSKQHTIAKQALFQSPMIH